MAVGIRSVTTAVSSGVTSTSISLTTPAASVGDLLLIILGNDYWQNTLTLTSITPTATSTNISSFTDDGGNNNPHINAWWAPVVTSGAVTVVADDGYVGGNEKFLAVYILTGCDTSSPVDDAANNGAMVSSNSPTTPTVSPASSTSMLFCHFQSDGSNAAPLATLTIPGDTNSQYDISDTSNFSRAIGINQQLATSGGTGGKIFTSSATFGWVASSVAIKAAATTPAVATNDVTAITPATAQGNGIVVAANGSGITERGFVWSTSANPTTSDNKVTASGTTGGYNASLTGLSDGTLYHVRAYATNGNGTTYGADVTFRNSSAKLSWIKS